MQESSKTQQETYLADTTINQVFRVVPLRLSRCMVIYLSLSMSIYRVCRRFHYYSLHYLNNVLFDCCPLASLCVCAACCWLVVLQCVCPGQHCFVLIAFLFPLGFSLRFSLISIILGLTLGGLCFAFLRAVVCKPSVLAASKNTAKR